MRLYHNPNCSKSRAALTLLHERGVKLEVVTYLEQPPSADELRSLVKMLGIRPRALLRVGEAAYEALGLADDSHGDDVLINAMASHPRLIERPILVKDGRAVIGRPPERVLELLDPPA